MTLGMQGRGLGHGSDVGGLGGALPGSLTGSATTQHSLGDVRLVGHAPCCVTAPDYGTNVLSGVEQQSVNEATLLVYAIFLCTAGLELPVFPVVFAHARDAS